MRDHATALIPVSNSQASPALDANSGTLHRCCAFIGNSPEAYGAKIMHGLIYLIGLIVVVLAILSFFGLR